MERLLKCDLISDKISRFYVNIDNNNIYELNKRNYFATNHTLNFTEIGQLIRRKLPQTVESYNYDDYLLCYHELLPIFWECDKLVTSDTLDVSTLHLEWLGNNYEFLKQSLKDAKTATTTTEHILLMTALLENALANIYYTSTARRIPPHLLRDLLTSKELFTVFGQNVIMFLKIVLGSPNSINLRNIAWHGFAKPWTIPSYYVSVLVITIHSLGSIVHCNNFISLQRAQILDISPYTNDILKEMNIVNASYVARELEESLLNNAVFAGNYKLYWQRLLYHYQHGNYWQFVVLILPQIELLLRLRYSEVNAYDVSAKLNEYYITMDTIFEMGLPNCLDKKNNLFPCTVATGAADMVLSEGAMMCLYDLFSAPHGPRLRDKVSHGEVALPALNNEALCTILLCMSMNLLTADEFKFPLNPYESRFHLNALVQETLLEASSQLKQLCKMHLNNNEHTLVVCDGIPGIREKNKIFQRPKSEAEFMLLIKKNCLSLKQTCLNYEESLNERLEKLEHRELHSRRRRTLNCQLAALPAVCEVLGNMLKCFALVYQSLQNNNDAIFMDAFKSRKCLKFLKQTLKLNENLVKYADKNYNQWIKMLELCKTFSDTPLKKLLISGK